MNSNESHDIDGENGQDHILSLDAQVADMFRDLPEFSNSWKTAGKVAMEFDPVSWSLWRIMRFVMGGGNRINRPPEGMVVGYLKFLKLVGNDAVLGKSVELVSEAAAVKHLSPDIVVAALFVHSIACRLQSRPLRKIWGGMLDDALVRSRIGLELGKHAPEFSSGRGLIAGMASRIGLVVLIASGTQQQAARTLQTLARGGSIVDTGLEVFSADPYHVSAQLMLRSGLGQDATIGVLAHGNSSFRTGNACQEQWRAALRIIEASRAAVYSKLNAEDWQALHLLDPELREDFKDEARLILRNGHGWPWLLIQSGHA